MHHWAIKESYIYHDLLCEELHAKISIGKSTSFLTVLGCPRIMLRCMICDRDGEKIPIVMVYQKGQNFRDVHNLNG